MRAAFTENFDTAFDAVEAARNRSIAPFICVPLVVGPGIGIVESLVKHDPDWAKPIPIMLPVMALFFFLFVTRPGRKFWMRLVYGKLLRKQYGQVAWDFEDHSIRCETSHGVQLTYQWECFKKIEEKTSGLFIRANVGMGVWLPRAAFAGEKNINDFLSLCERHGVAVVGLGRKS